MCLRTREIKKEFKELVQVADRDILVYKKLGFNGKGEYITPYRGVKWPKSGTMTVKKFGTSMVWPASRDIHSGIHAYARKMAGYFTAIIPKGTKFIVSCSGTEVVTLKLKLMPDLPTELTEKELKH